MAVAPWPVVSVIAFSQQVQYGLLEATRLAVSALVFVGGWFSLIAVLAGLPMHFIYRRLNWSAWWAYALGGAAVAVALATTIVVGPSMPEGPRTRTAPRECQDIVNGARTACGWENVYGAIGLAGGVGAVNGVVFWSLLRWRKRPAG